MRKSGTVELKTDRLLLRRFRIEDRNPMFNNWASSPDVTKFLTWPAHESPEITKMVLESWIEQYGDNHYYNWAITFKDQPDDPIGSITVVEMDEKAKKAHIGYCIGKKWWHQGITCEALIEVIHYLFDTVGINRIEARHDPNNPDSGKVMKKAGMVYEGTMLQSDWNNQGICDACYYRLLKSER